MFENRRKHGDKAEIKIMATETGQKTAGAEQEQQQKKREQSGDKNYSPADVTAIPIQLVANVEKITLGNAIKEPLYVTNAVKRGTMQGDVLLRS